MISTQDNSSYQVASGPLPQTIWSILILTAGITLSGYFACATPFAALATLAALKLGWRETTAVIGVVWLANQAVGYFVLGYPWTWDSAAWGIAIGLATGFAVVAAYALSTTRPAPLAMSLPFVSAFTVFEASLYVAGFVLPGSDGGFTTSIVTQIFLINAVTLCALVALYHLVVWAIGREASIPVTSASFR